MAITRPSVGDQATAAWADSVADALNNPFLGEASSVSILTLSTTSAFAGLATETFTLIQQTRVEIKTVARCKGTSGGRIQVQSAYNTGSSANIATAVLLGQPFDCGSDANSLWSSGFGIGTALLAAGTYTAYASLKRFAGAATDTADDFYVSVLAVGFS